MVSFDTTFDSLLTLVVYLSNCHCSPAKSYVYCSQSNAKVCEATNFALFASRCCSNKASVKVSAALTIKPTVTELPTKNRGAYLVSYVKQTCSQNFRVNISSSKAYTGGKENILCRQILRLPLQLKRHTIPESKSNRRKKAHRQRKYTIGARNCNASLVQPYSSVVTILIAGMAVG